MLIWVIETCRMGRLTAEKGRCVDLHEIICNTGAPRPQEATRMTVLPGGNFIFRCVSYLVKGVKVEMVRGNGRTGLKAPGLTAGRFEEPLRDRRPSASRCGANADAERAPRLST